MKNNVMINVRRLFIRKYIFHVLLVLILLTFHVFFSNVPYINLYIETLDFFGAVIGAIVILRVSNNNGNDLIKLGLILCLPSIVCTILNLTKLSEFIGVIIFALLLIGTIHSFNENKQ